MQVMGNIFVVTKVSTLLIITPVSSGLKKSHVISSLANISTFMLRYLV